MKRLSDRPSNPAYYIEDCWMSTHLKLISYLFFQLWVAYAPCGAQHKDAVQVTLEQVDLIKRLVEAYPNQLELVRTADGK